MFVPEDKRGYKKKPAAKSDEAAQEGETAEADLLVLVCPMILAGAGFRLLWQGGRVYLRFAK